MYIIPELRAIIMEFGRQRTLKEIHFDICFYLYKHIKPSDKVKLDENQLIEHLELTNKEKTINNLNIMLSLWKYFKQIYYKIHIPYLDNDTAMIYSEKDDFHRNMLDKFFKIVDFMPPKNK